MRKGAVWPVVLIIAALLIIGGFFAIRPAPANDAKVIQQSAAPSDVVQAIGDTPQDVVPVAEGRALREKWQGTLLAGSVEHSPLLDFTRADYDVALQSGKLILLYFYANWCPICARETAESLYPAFNELARADIIGFRVNYNDTDTDADEKNLARTFGVAYQHTKVFVKDGVRTLKSPESWDKSRYLLEINKAAPAPEP